MNKKKQILVIVLLVVLVVATGCLIFWNQKKLASKNNIIFSDNVNEKNTIEQEGVAWKSVQKSMAKLWFDNKDDLIKVGDEIKVSVKADTDNNNVVLVATEIIFDSDFLEFVDRDFENSSFGMSIMDTTKDNLLQIVRGQPGDANPNDVDDGFTGSDGLVANLYFRAKKQGETSVVFQETEKSSDEIGTLLILDDGQSTLLGTQKNNLELKIY